MAGVIGANALQALKLLTPQEIQRITESKNKRKLSTLEIVVDEESGIISPNNSQTADNAELAQNQAKVLHLRKEQERQRELKNFDPYKAKSVQEHASEIGEKEFVAQPLHSQSKTTVTNSNKVKSIEKSIVDSKLEEIGIYSAEKIKQEQDERERQEKSLQDSSTVFILKEKEKIKSSQRKLKKQEVLKSYDQNANVEIRKKASGEDIELLESENKGILFNKKQF